MRPSAISHWPDATTMPIGRLDLDEDHLSSLRS